MRLPELYHRIIALNPVTRKWGDKWGRWSVWGLGALMVIILLSTLFGSESNSVSQNYVVVRQGDFEVDLVETGDVEAVSQVVISAPMMWGAKLQVIDLIDEGTIVKKDDFLLQFDVSDLDDQLKLRKDQLASLLADLDKLKAQQSLTIFTMDNAFKTAEFSYEQAQLRLEMRQFESQAKQEEARLQLKQAEIDLERTRKQLENQKIIHKSQIIQRETALNESRNRVASTQERIDRLKLTAPTDGMVVYTQLRGERVKEGYEARPGWPLMSIPDLSRMQIKLFVNEADRLKLKTGQAVTITLEAYPDTVFTGKIHDVSRLAQNVTGAENLKGFVVYAAIDGSDPRLKPGMTAQVRIILETLEDVMVVPVSAVFEVESQPVVFPVGRTKPHAVYLGPRNDGFVVVESGLTPGMRLSCQNPLEESAVLGRSEERRRIASLRETLEESFDIFQQRGILHNYEKTDASLMPNADAGAPRVDLEKLPATIRERLQNHSGNRSGSTRTESDRSGVQSKNRTESGEREQGQRRQVTR